MKKNSLTFLFLVIILFIFAGCSSNKDCSEFDTTYVKYGYDDAAKKCIPSQTIQENVCGNKIIEEDENFCNCPEDVQKTHPTLGCQGIKGEYLEYTCSSKDTCVMEKNDKPLSQTKVLEFKSNDLILNGEITLDTPYIINTYTTNPIKLDLELDYFTKTDTYKVKNIMIQKLEVIDKAKTKLGDVEANYLFKGIDDSTLLEFTLTDTSQYYTYLTFDLFLTITYDADVYDRNGNFIETQNKRVTLGSGLSKWPTINANLDP